ncbi:MAG: glycosyltransferase family 4 protein [Terracidiphilus sp.]
MTTELRQPVSHDAPLGRDFLQVEDSVFESPGRRPQHKLAGKRAGMVVFSQYPLDPRPRRAADALLQEGVSVDLICEAENGSPRRERIGGLDITRIPIRHYRGGALSYIYQYSLFILISAAVLAWRTMRRRYNLIYVHNMPDVLVVAALIPKLFGARVILDQHDPMPELMMTIFGKSDTSVPVRVLRWLEKWSIQRADLLITVNAACKKIFSVRSCPAEKIGVVMNSPDQGLFPYHAARSYPTRSVNQPFVVVFHGSLVERNGLHLAVDALALLHKAIPELELRVYGRSTSYLEQIMAKARSTGLEGRVVYLGPKKLEDLAGEIEQCDVGIVPNQRNTFTDINTPTRIFEYLALGKPVIAPRTPGITDYFDSDSLIFFEPGNSEDLAKRIEFACSHPGEARAIAERGQAVYLRHTWQQEREKLLTAVSTLLES